MAASMSHRAKHHCSFFPHHLFRGILPKSNGTNTSRRKRRHSLGKGTYDEYGISQAEEQFEMETQVQATVNGTRPPCRVASRASEGVSFHYFCYDSGTNRVAVIVFRLDAIGVPQTPRAEWQDGVISKEFDYRTEHAGYHGLAVCRREVSTHRREVATCLTSMDRSCGKQ